MSSDSRSSGSGRDTGIKRVINRIVKAREDDFKDESGTIDKEALTAFVLDELERLDPDFLEMLEREGARQYVWEAIRELHRRTRKDMKAEVEEAIAEIMQPKLPSLEEVEPITISFPVGTTEHAAKGLLDCALWEIRAAEEEYGKKADALLQHQRFLYALTAHMEKRGFKESDTVRDLYRKTG